MFASVSLIAVGAFILTLAVVVYEVIMLRKKKSPSQQQQQTVNLPDYQQDPKAVQSMTTVPNVANAQIPQEATAEAPMQARELPSRGRLFALAAVLIVVVVLIGGAFFLNSRRAEKKITQANVETTPKPTKTQIVTEPTAKPRASKSTPTPTTVITIVVKTGDVSITPDQDESTQDKGSTSSPSLKPTRSLTTTPTETVSSGSASISPTKAAEMPKSGIINQTVILATISVLFIVLAFVL